MKGILRTAILCYACVPLQRRLLAIGAVLILAGHVGALTVGIVDAPLLPVSLLLGLMLIFVSLLPSGAIWCAISAPRTLRFLPYARLKLLLGVLLADLSLVIFLTANLALLQLETRPTPWLHASLSGVFVVALALQTAVTVGFFLLSRPRRLLVIVVLLIGYGLFRWLGIAPGVASRMASVPMGALLILCTWGALALWYLRAPRVSPPGRHMPLWERRPGQVSKHHVIDASRESAIAAYLVGLPSVARLIRRGLFIGLALALCMLVLIVQTAARGQHATAVSLLLFSCPIAIGTYAGVVVGGAAYRSGALWVRAGCSRQQLFLLCERFGWYSFGAVGLPIVALAAATWIFTPPAANDWRYQLLALLAPAVCTLYVGLMSIRGWSFSDVMVGVLVWITGLGAGVKGLFLSSTADAPRMMLIPIALLVGALALRWVAQRRWQRIDWLICKPPRLSSQALRPVA